MNNKIIIVILILVIVIFAGCESNQGNKIGQELTFYFDVQYIRTDGYVDGVTYPIISVINSKEELNDYYTGNKNNYDLERKEKIYMDSTIGFLDAVDKYDDIYFKDNILVFVLLEEASGSVRHEVTEVKQIEGNIEININRIVPEEATDDMANWHIMVELKKDDYNNSQIKVKFE